MSDATTRRASRDAATLVAVLLVAGVLAAGAALGACGDSSDGAQDDGPRPGAPALAADGAVDGADITGRVTSAAGLDGDGAGLTFLVEDGRGAYDKASVTTTAATGWYRVVDGGLEETDAPATGAALAGATVAVAFTGPVAESYPVQATAGWVVLLP